MAAITQTQLENAAADAVTLEGVVNNAPGTSIVSRLGRTLIAISDIIGLTGFVTLATSQTITGKKTMSGGITGLPAPSASSDAARKTEIDALNTLIVAISGQPPYATAALGQSSALATGALFYVVPSTHGGVTDIYTKGASSPTYVGAVPSVDALSLKLDVALAVPVIALRQNQEINLCDPTQVTYGWYVQGDGSLGAAPWNLSNPIPIEIGKSYSCWKLNGKNSTVSANFSHYRFLDANENYISGSYAAGVHTVTAPAGSVYFQFDEPNTQGPLSNFAVVKGTDMPSVFPPFSGTKVSQIEGIGPHLNKINASQFDQDQALDDNGNLYSDTGRRTSKMFRVDKHTSYTCGEVAVLAWYDAAGAFISPTVHNATTVTSPDNATYAKAQDYNTGGPLFQSWMIETSIIDANIANGNFIYAPHGRFVPPPSSPYDMGSINKGYLGAPTPHAYENVISVGDSIDDFFYWQPGVSEQTGIIFRRNLGHPGRGWQCAISTATNTDPSPMATVLNSSNVMGVQGTLFAFGTNDFGGGVSLGTAADITVINMLDTERYMQANTIGDNAGGTYGFSGVNWTDFYRVDPSTSYTYSHSTVVQYFDATQTFISAENGSSFFSGTRATPSNCYFIRFGYHTTDQSTYMAVKGTSLPAYVSGTPTTLYGYVRRAFDTYLAYNPSMWIGVIIPIPRFDMFINGGHTLDDYCNAIKTVCEVYGIPYLDMKKVSGINQANWFKYLSADDKLHPSSYNFYVRKVSQFVNTNL